jgi:hypothetical protein
MAAVIRITDVGSDLKLKRPEKSVNEKQSVATAISKVAVSGYFPGLLLKKGLLLLIISTIMDA